MYTSFMRLSVRNKVHSGATAAVRRSFRSSVTNV